MTKQILWEVLSFDQVVRLHQNKPILLIVHYKFTAGYSGPVYMYITVPNHNAKILQSISLACNN